MPGAEDVGLSIAVEADDGCTVEETKGVGETPEYFNKIEAFGEIMEDAVGALGGRSVGGYIADALGVLV